MTERLTEIFTGCDSGAAGERKSVAGAKFLGENGSQIRGRGTTEQQRRCRLRLDGEEEIGFGGDNGDRGDRNSRARVHWRAKFSFPWISLN